MRNLVFVSPSPQVGPPHVYITAAFRMLAHIPRPYLV